VRWCLLALVACGAGGDPGLDAADSTCTHAPSTPIAIGTVNVGSRELSGLAASHTVHDLLWTHGDHGDTADIHGISATTAAAHGTLHLDATAVDWEDIATAPCMQGRCIYVADTGDNDLNRASVAIFVVPEPASDPVGAVATSFTRYDVMYPDGAHNVEAVFVDPRDQVVYAIEKVASKHANVYKLPLSGGAVALAVQVAQLTIPGDDPRVTAADLVIDGCNARLAIRTYDALYELRAAATSSIPALLGGALAAMPVADEPHGEAVAYSEDGHAYFTISEGDQPALHRVSD